MAETTGISWADSTLNPWVGCVEVGPGCDHCYARTLSERYGWAKWGSGEQRHRTSVATWNRARSWNRKAALTGYKPRVFCASLADVFDNEVPDSWRTDLWQLLRDTPNLRWMLLTKRIGNAAKMVPSDWPFQHVGIMATMVNQEEYDRDRLKLSAVPAPWRGISVEPLLGRIILDHVDAAKNLHWVITGGESGPEHRPLDTDAVRYLRDQCAALGIAFHHKQNGGIRPKEHGCLIDGREHKNFPAALAA